VTVTTVYYYCVLTQVCSTNGSLAGHLAAFNNNEQCILGSIVRNDHIEAAFHYSELSVSFGTCQHSQRPNATLFTCKHCSHSSTLRDEVQKEAALAQALQVLQAVAAAALAQVVTCERMFLN
jgi:hypothetical protein